MYKSKAGRVDYHYEQIGSLDKMIEKTLVIGNSYVNASFRPSEDDKRFYKLIVSGMPLDDIVNIIETLPPNTDFKSIVIGLSYMDAQPVRSRAYIYRQYSAENWLSRFWWSIPLVRGNSLASTILKEDVKCLVKLNRAKSCAGRLTFGLENLDEELAMEAIGDEYGIPTSNEEDQMARSVSRRYQEFAPFMLDISPQLKIKLMRIKTICAQKRISLFAYTAPIIKELRLRLNNDVIEGFRSTVTDVGIPYVDLNLVFPDWDYSYFHDASHVKANSGGKMTTTYLISYIGEDIAQSGPN